MELLQLIEALSHPSAYPNPVQNVEVRHTHISVVFLAGSFAYKIKKPLNLGFLDFSTLAQRQHFCTEEVRLNRRLAPTVYLGVVPVSRIGHQLCLEKAGEVVEWAVKMQRLPDTATFRDFIMRDQLGPELVEMLAKKLARFHAEAETTPAISAFGRLAIVAQNVHENFEQTAPQVGVTVNTSVFDRLRALSEAALTRLGPLMEQRAERGVVRDTHGDLRLDHIYFFQDRSDDDLIIIDCIEFNERFRYADPVADMAFLNMDLLFHGRRDLAEAFAKVYFQAAKDEEGKALLPFYTAYRAVVRSKVEGMELIEKEIPPEEASAAMTKARAHWLLALSELEEPKRKPCLILMGGLPGTGKSTLARGLAEHADFQVIRSDIVRKGLSGQGSENGGIYTPAWQERTYAECLRRAEELLYVGKRVLVDATFREENKRHRFLEHAVRLGVPAVLFVCRAEPEVVRERLKNRRNDASDADWSIYTKLAAEWEEPGTRTGNVLCEIVTSDNPDQDLEEALDELRARRLF